MNGIAVADAIGLPESQRRGDGGAEMVVTPLEVENLQPHEAAALQVDGLLQLRRLLLLLQLPPQERLVAANVAEHHPWP